MKHENFVVRTGKSTGCTSCGLRTHGSSDTKEYHIWEAMKNRCTSPGNRQYQDYGGRGISYDPRWEQFEHFIADMGLCPEGMTLERVDNSAGYNKDNCKWASWVENLSNTRKNVKVTVRGHTHHLAEWVRIIGKEVGRSMRKYKKDNKCTWAVAIEFYLQKYHIDMEKLG